MNKNNFAIIDIGSHSVRMLLSQGGVNEKFSIITRLGEGSAIGCLTDAAMDRTFNAVREFHDKADGCPIYAFATSAMRDAENRSQFIARVKDSLGISIDLLSGEQEARLAYAGASIGVEKQKLGVIDIGGGSTEIVVGENGSVLSANSYQAGAVRLTDRKLSVPEMIAYAKNICAFDPPPPSLWRGIGGTITSLAAMDLRLGHYDEEIVQNHPLEYENVLGWAMRLERLSVPERAKLPGLQPQRAPVILAGVCVLVGVMETVSANTVHACVSDNLLGMAKWLQYKVCPSAEGLRRPAF